MPTSSLPPPLIFLTLIFLTLSPSFYTLPFSLHLWMYTCMCIWVFMYCEWGVDEGRRATEGIPSLLSISPLHFILLSFYHILVSLRSYVFFFSRLFSHLSCSLVGLEVGPYGLKVLRLRSLGGCWPKPGRTVVEA